MRHVRNVRIMIHHVPNIVCCTAGAIVAIGRVEACPDENSGTFWLPVCRTRSPAGPGERRSPQRDLRRAQPACTAVHLNVPRDACMSAPGPGRTAASAFLVGQRMVLVGQVQLHEHRMHDHFP
jgi:hypothetical protein